MSLAFTAPELPALQFDAVTLRLRLDGRREDPLFDEFTHSFSFRRIHAIVGESGCGKSTLLSMIVGATKFDSGRVSVFGENPTVAIKNHEVGLAEQDPSILPWRTVRENAGLGHLLGCFGSEVCDVGEYLDLVGVKDQKAPARKLSGGERKRVGLVRALLHAPKLVLLDEPFGSCDIESRRLMIMLLLLHLDRHPNTTTVLVTHSIEEAALLAHRVHNASGSPFSVKSQIDQPEGPIADRSRDRLRPKPGSESTFSKRFDAITRTYHDECRLLTS